MNRETFPASQSPLAGDIRGNAGDTLVRVQGFQGRPISPEAPLDTATWRYDANLNMWFPVVPANVAIRVNGEAVSDDYLIYVNATFVKVNGVTVAP